jgi:HK97 gp10 family phage protein
VIQAKISGIKDFRQELSGLVPKLRVRAIRNALAAGAKLVRDDAKRRAPLLSVGSKARHRLRGTLQRAIAVRTSKLARRAGNVGVFVNVRPAKKGQRGAKSLLDPYYWQFQEFGTRYHRARSFLQPAAARLADALRVFEAKLGAVIQRMNRPKAPTP